MGGVTLSQLEPVYEEVCVQKETQLVGYRTIEREAKKGVGPGNYGPCDFETCLDYALLDLPLGAELPPAVLSNPAGPERPHFDTPIASGWSIFVLGIVGLILAVKAAKRRVRI